MPEEAPTKQRKPLKESSTMSIDAVYGEYRAPSFTEKLRNAFASFLMKLAEVNAKNQDVEPFGL